MIEIITAISLWELVKHAGSWVANLKRARGARKRESIAALRKVIIAADRTAVYLREIRDTGKRSHRVEGELAQLWTELAFALEDLGIERLAQRCRISGKQWAKPEDMNPDYLRKAHLGLLRMEAMAREVLKDIGK
jgi:hypothetical protein